MREYSKEEPLLMIPGPVESRQNVLNAMSTRMYSHTETLFVSAFQNSLKNLRPIFGASAKYSPLVVAGGGTLAMEIALINLIDMNSPQSLLICETGYFGSRYTSIAQIFNQNVSSLAAPIGNKISEEQLSTFLEKNQVDVAFIQHVDTSTGVANDIEMFGKLCAEYDVISVVDGVCALGGQPFFQNEWNIDIYFTGAQKALALPPGLAIMMYSPRAREISENRENIIPSYYSNLSNWWPVMDAYLDGKVSYFSTPATNLIVGLEEATNNLLEEGMDKVYKRHEYISTKFRNEMTEMGFEFLTAEDSLANTMTTPKYLALDKGTEFRQRVLNEGVLIAGGIQKGIAGTYFRVGHMGTVTENQIDHTLSAIRRAI